MDIEGVRGFLACHGYPREKKTGFLEGEKRTKRKTEKRFLGGFFPKSNKTKRLKVEILQFLAG